MVELIAAKGYPAVRISDLARLAHVSPPTLYDLYRDKEQLFLGTYDELAQQTRGTIQRAYADAERPEQRLDAVIGAFAELAAADPRGVSLLVLGAFGAGENALERRRRTLEALEAIIHGTRGDQPPHDPADLTVKAIIGGIREVAAKRLRDGRHEELPALAGTLSAWAGCYPRRLPEGLAAPTARSLDADAWRGASERARRAEGRLPSGRSELTRRVIMKSQRERIVDATAAIVAEKGLPGLTIPEIARRANVSNQTFYSIYASKQEAFLGAQKVGLHQALRVCAGAYERELEDWPGAVAAGISALLEFLASEPAHAKLSLLQMYAAGPEAIAVRNSSMRAFGGYLRAGVRFAGAPLQEPEIVAEAVVGGIWQILHHYVEADSIDALPATAPQLTYFALAPSLGSEAAAEAALAPV
jgi:AcrR family transcriptional regulator